VSPNESQITPRWVATTDALEDVVDTLLQCDEYAIDTEFHRERTFYPHLALVQLGWADGIVLLDPLAVDLAPLARLLDSDVLAVFHAADQDLEVLEYACGVVPRKIWDTQIAAGFVGFSSASLVTLCERILGLKLSKGDRLTDWTRRPLSATQMTYAAADVAHLLTLRSMITEQLERAGRSSWLDAEFELLRTRPRAQVHGPKAWWRLKEGRVLRGRDRLVAQELCAWREQRAREDDKPVRFVVPDLAVVSIAQAKPTRLDEIGQIRGMDGRYLKGGAGAEMLAAVARGVDLPNSALALPESEDFDRRLRPALTLASAWVAQLAQDAKLDPTLLATRSDLVHFLRGDADARLASGWRNAVAGQAIAALVGGEAALAFERGGLLILEERSRKTMGAPIATPNAPWAEENAGPISAAE
jgi:ribonuclease D